MRGLLGMVVFLALAVAGVGVVRPRATEWIGASWEAVDGNRLEIPLEDGAYVDLTEAGDFVVFLEGPEDHALWDQVGVARVEALSLQSRRAVASVRNGSEYGYTSNGRHARGLARITVSLPGTHEFRFGSGASLSDLRKSGFALWSSPAKLVADSSRQATVRLVGSIAAALLAGAIGLSLLVTRQG